jgi:polysaccharide biosynthesis transport protein
MTLIQRAPIGGMDAGGRLARSDGPWIFDLHDAWASVRAHWKVVLAVPLVLIALVVGWRVLVPAQYTATTRLLIDPNGLQVVANEVNQKAQIGDASLLVIDSQINVLTSNSVLGRVVDSEHLDKDPEFTKLMPLQAAMATLASAIGSGAVSVDDRTAAIGNLRSHISAQRVDQTFVIEVNVATRRRDKSVRLADAITTAYLAADQAARTESARRASMTTAARLDELSRTARDADDAVQQFKAAHNIVGSGQELVSDQQLAEMTTALGTAHARTAEQRARLDQVESVARGEAGLESIAEVVQSATIAQLRAQLATAESQLDGLLTQGGERLPAVIAARAQVGALRQQIANEVGRIASAVGNDYERARSNEAALQTSLDRLKSQAVRLSEDSVQMRELQRQADAARKVYESFLVRSRELSEQQGLYTSASRVISPPLVPSRRDGAPFIAVLAGALIAGLGLGAGGVLLGEQASTRVLSRDRLEQITGRPVLASLPSLPALTFDGNEAVPANARDIDRSVSLLLTRLRNRAHRPGGAPLAILVTSGDDARNKSSLALYLALCGTLDRRNVLLVDADPRGLVTQAVCGGRDRKSDLPRETIGGEAVSHVDSFPGLRVISPLDGVAVEQLVSARFLEEIEGCDLIVIDAPLLGSDLVAERLIADNRIGAIVFTASARRSTTGAVRRAIAAIEQDSRLAPVLCDETRETSIG